ncbi:PREDICTED: thiosulfate sulfurtransferase/rhodanese-like domain-containing protein 1 [Branchiostoma belcheri]|uniref:Thiosulfate sulfurtransferase/rhodanese-like domain-containing protein 1 n=1 Tax=Branchiostoma belcheri TaxID=7741 RepID=A0A6P4ZHG9_BRABE|nr:PREDICTED: thiosulfate sulfurtransferase/rhodanese-like domain-containing protein 1 [Branchiostoma belcheri]
MQSAGEVTFSELKEGLTSGDLQVFDVWRPEELQQDGRMVGSTNIPLDELEAALLMSDGEFQEQYGVRKPQKEDENIVLTCRSGRRTKLALPIVHRLGYTRARIYAGGIIEWKKHHGVN